MEEVKKYVVSFIFKPGCNDVWLIRKNKPEWQKGCLNGIGGKVEKTETYRKAAIRELQEEAGIFIGHLLEVGYMQGKNNDGSKFRVGIFTAISDQELKTMESEIIDIFNINDIKTYKHIENIPMLIETCIYNLLGHSHFSKLIMQYNQ